MAAMSRRSLCLLAILFIFSAIFSPAFATEVTVFGPKTYVRTTGSPNVYTDTFSSFPKEGLLIIENGDKDGKHRVTSALVFINGVQIFAPDDFKQQIYLMEAPVDLSDSTKSLVVELRSKPGTYLTIRVIQEAEPPTVTITADPLSIPLGASSILTWTSANADSAAIDEGIGSVPVNGSITVSPTETTTYSITASGPRGTATAGATVTVIYPPSITIIEPDGIDDIADCSFTIQWTDDDPDDNATISLYYDTDNSGADGTLIISGLSEDPDGIDDQYHWDTAEIPEGDYYVYGVIDDDVNDPVVDYSEGEISITHFIPDEIKVTASDPASYANFGNAVSISGDYAIVGAYQDDDNGYRSGSAYIFKRDCHSWLEQAKLTAGDGTAYDYFGCSVSISGDYAIMGAYYDDDNGYHSGSAYIFKREGEAWLEQAKLTAGDGTAYANFGNAVSISGDYAIVGAYGDDDSGYSSGSAYIFKREGEAWAEKAKLTASDADEGYQFGWSVSIDGDYVIVSALGDVVYEEDTNYCGSVYIFKREGDIWVEQTKLFAAGTADQYLFGYSVAINNSYAVVGAVGKFYEVPLSGAAYIYKHEGNMWLEQAIVTADNPSRGDNFGISVSIEENYVVVGAFDMVEYEPPSTAYVFEPEGDSWICRFKLTPSDGGGNHHGFSVAISGEYGIVGAPEDYEVEEEAGAAYIYSIANYAKRPFISFVEPDGIDDIADCSFTIQWDDADLDDNATISLYYDTDNSGADGTLIISGLSEDPDGPDDQYVWETAEIEAGTYYIYAVIDDGNNDPSIQYSKGPIQVHTIYSINKVTASDAAAYDDFGSSVSISGDYAIVGADGDDDSGYSSGSAYIFQREGEAWVEQSKLTASDGAAYDDFGNSVSINGDYAIVGAFGDDDNGNVSGSAYIFKNEGTNWAEQTKLTASDGAAYDDFGSSVSISGDYAIVGAYGDDDSGYSSGSAYIFKREGEAWIEHAKLTASDGAVGDYFGNSVSINGGYAIVGARDDDNIGSAYIFKREGDVWGELFKLTAGDREDYDYYGHSVSINGGHVIVGACLDDDNEDESGSAYIYSIVPGYISADPESIFIGESTTLSWSFPNATLVTIDNGIGEVPGTGSVTVMLDNTTTYTATAEGCWGTVSDSITIEVREYPPTIIISAYPEIINLGGSATLTWSSTNATSCVIEPDVGDVATTGSTTVSPSETTTYTITATGPGGTAIASVTVAIAAPTVEISADPEIINLGESATLSWSSTNATSCVIEPGIGSVDVSGSIAVSLTTPTTYTITATGPGGTTTDSVTVTVTFPQPTVSISADPATIQIGGSSTLTWSSTNATSCVIEPDVGDVATSGSTTVSPSETTTYTITATGPGGTSTASFTVAVTYPVPIITLSAEPEVITIGESSTLTWSSQYADSCMIDQGIGSVDLSGSTYVTPTETTTYTITASNPGETATAGITVTVIPLNISIISPLYGDTISRPDIMVEGTITNPLGSEVGITVNGIVAMVAGDQFMANHIPLEQGENTLTATAVDWEGNMASASITVYADTEGEYIRITADTESGTSPLETTLRIEGSFTFTDPYLTYTGPGLVEFLGISEEHEYDIRITGEGVYYFTAEVTDTESNTYTDSIAVVVIDQAELDALLKAKWEGMKTTLVNGDIEGALEYFTDGRSRQRYSEIFSFIDENVPGGISAEAQKLPEPILIELKGNFATYILARDEDGTMIEYTLYFVKDGYGFWRIQEY